MAERRPIVLQAGRLAELPVGGSLAGMAESLAALPLATWAVPDEFLVQQGGQWARATYAQMQAWFAATPVPDHGYGLMTELGECLLTESGEYLILESGAAPATGACLLTESGEFLLTEAGEYLIQEAGAAGAYVLTELGGALLTEAGGFITQELT